MIFSLFDHETWSLSLRNCSAYSTWNGDGYGMLYPDTFSSFLFFNWFFLEHVSE